MITGIPLGDPRVIHGHGGWFDIQSQKHYDLMKKGEEGLVSTRLGGELAKCMGAQPAEGVTPRWAP